MSDRALHDVSVLVVRLDSDRPPSAVLEALLREIERGTLRLVDFLTVRRDGNRAYEIVEPDERMFGLAGLGLRVPGLVGLTDAEALTADLPPNSSAALILVEPTWFERLSSELTRLGADVVGSLPVAAAHANFVWRSATAPAFASEAEAEAEAP